MTNIVNYHLKAAKYFFWKIVAFYTVQETSVCFIGVKILLLTMKLYCGNHMLLNEVDII